VATTTSKFDQLKLENSRLAEEKKDAQAALSKAKEEVTALHGENNILTLSRDQLASEKTALEA
jgi:predicted nuclease with TOPRIM domain